MMLPRPRTLTMLTLTCCAAGFGPLDPPAGPIQGTSKPLSEVEPRTAIGPATTPGDSDSTPSLYKITQAGSYYLTGNIQAEGNVVAIEVASDNVTIDLGGFTVSRSGAGAGTASLIQRVNSPQNTTVRNGTLSNSGKHGLDLANHARIERLSITDTADTGVVVSSRSIVEDCVVDTSGQSAITVGPDSRIVGCIVYGSGSDGIVGTTNCEVSSCRVNNSGGHGIEVAYGSVVEGCSVRSSALFGISSSLNSGVAHFERNIVTLNTGGGIRAYGSSRITGNTVSMSGTAAPCILIVGDGNHVEDNLTSSGSDSVRIEPTGDDNLVVGNVAQNPGVGNGFTNVNLAANMIGPVVTAGGSISTSSPFANFSR